MKSILCDDLTNLIFEFRSGDKAYYKAKMNFIAVSYEIMNLYRYRPKRPDRMIQKSYGIGTFYNDHISTIATMYFSENNDRSIDSICGQDILHKAFNTSKYKYLHNFRIELDYHISNLRRLNYLIYKI